MEESRRQEIDRIAADISAGYGIRTPINDIDETVRKLGGTVCEKKTIAGAFAGEIEKDGAGFRITVSSSLDAKRRNFTVAHELGHLFLHMHYNDKALWEKAGSRYYLGGNDAKEQEADEFAAAFLMPAGGYEKHLHSGIAENGRADLYMVAGHYNVPVDEAIRRGRVLGYIQDA